MVSRVEHAVPTWTDTVILRVAIEGRGYVGFIEIDSESTLQDAREVIRQDLDDFQPNETHLKNSQKATELTSPNYRFLLPDGVPIGLKQEKRRLAMDFLPCVFVRVPAPVVQQNRETTTMDTTEHHSRNENQDQNISNDNLDENKVTVLFGNDQFSAWVTPSYTFGQLRNDAAKFWNVKPSNIVLLDEGKCSWPEDALVSFALHKGLVQMHKVYMHLKRRPQSVASRDGLLSPISSPLPRESQFERPSQNNNAHVSTARPRSFGLSRTDTDHTYYPLGVSSPGVGSQSAQQKEHRVSQYAMGYSPGAHQEASVLNRYSQLWRCFTYYCVQGNALTPDRLDSRRLLLMMRDCRVLSSRISPTVVSLAFTSCTCATVARSSKKTSLDFDQFLDVLVMIATKLYPVDEQNSSEGVSNSFTALLTRHILPMASSWSSLAWERMANAIYNPVVMATLEPFIGAFYELFKFYAPQVRSNQVDMETELYLGFDQFTLFGLDFSFNSIGLTSSNLAEVFLASGECKGIGTQFDDGEGGIRYGIDPDDSQESSTVACLHPNGQAAWDNPVMYFPQFLDAIARSALVAYGAYRADNSTKTDNCPPCSDMVLALIQHMAKELKQANVIQLVEKRHNLSTYPAGFVKGASKLVKSFSHVWVTQGQPDFLSRNTMDLHARAVKGRSMSNTDTALFGDFRQPTHSIASATRGREVLSQIVHQERIGQVTMLPGFSEPQISPHRNRINWYPGSSTPSRYRFDGDASDPSYLSNLPDETGFQFKDNGFDRNVGLQAKQQQRKSVKPPVSIESESKHVHRSAREAHRNNNIHGSPYTKANDGQVDTATHAREGNSSQVGRYQSESLNNHAQVRSTIIRSNKTQTELRDDVSASNTSMQSTSRLGRDSYTRNNQSNGHPKNHSLKPNSNHHPSRQSNQSRVNGTVESKSPEYDQVPETTIQDQFGRQMGEPMLNSEDRNEIEHEFGDEESKSGDTTTVDYMQVLTRGEVFLKHGRRGVPHRRFVWYDPKNMRMCWCPANKRDKHGTLKGRYIDMRSVRSITPGRKTDVFKRHHTSSSVFSKGSHDTAAEQSDDEKCFSLVAAGRTLDLEADAPGIRDNWVEALLNLEV